MAYHKYTTQAFVIEANNQGESNKSYLLFTHDLGMIRASAQSVRESKSKLRFALEEYALSEVCVVRGKSSWKITSASSTTRYYHHFKSDRKIEIVAQICSLLKRLLHGEENNAELFSLLARAFEYLATQTLKDEELKNFECILVFRRSNNTCTDHSCPPQHLRFSSSPVWDGEPVNAWVFLHTKLPRGKLWQWLRLWMCAPRLSWIRITKSGDNTPGRIRIRVKQETVQQVTTRMHFRSHFLHPHHMAA